MSNHSKPAINTQHELSSASAITKTAEQAAQATDIQNLSIKIVGLIDKYNRLLDTAAGADLESLVSYVSFMAAKKEPLFVLLEQSRL